LNRWVYLVALLVKNGTGRKLNPKHEKGLKGSWGFAVERFEIELD
jgi:hypothetical protein